MLRTRKFYIKQYNKSSTVAQQKNKIFIDKSDLILDA